MTRPAVTAWHAAQKMNNVALVGFVPPLVNPPARTRNVARMVAADNVESAPVPAIARKGFVIVKRTAKRSTPAVKPAALRQRPAAATGSAATKSSPVYGIKRYQPSTAVPHFVKIRSVAPTAAVVNVVSVVMGWNALTPSVKP